MSAIALNDRDINLMADGGDPGIWMAVVGGISALSALSGAAATLLFRSRDTAKQDGRNVGAIEVRLQAQDTSMAGIRLEMQAIETRILGRLTGYETRNSRIDERLAEFATREEIQTGQDRISRQIDALSAYVHETRGHRAPSSI